jgi:hypothetical protein
MKRGKRHPLLAYHYVHRQRRNLFLFSTVVFLGLFSLPFVLPADLAQKLWPPEFDGLFLAGGILSLLVFAFKVVAPRLAYIRCAERNIRLQTPFFPVFIAYKRIANTRPNQWGNIYPPEKRKGRLRRTIEPIVGAEVIVIDLKGWPAPRGWLRLWIPDLMFSPDGAGLVLWVADWMALSRELRDFSDRRRDTLIGPKEEASLYAKLKR